MNPVSFQKRYEDVWDQLENLLSHRIGRRDSGRSHAIGERARLYREISSHLSFARTYFPDHEVTRRLNALIARAHVEIYGRKSGEWKNAWLFMSRAFPASVREVWLFFVLSWGIMLAGMLVGFLAVLHAPDAAYTLLPSSFLQQFDPAQAGPHAVDAPLMSSTIMMNNIRVTILAFLGAFTFGLLTCVILYQNGIILGALAALFLQAHRSLVFWSLIVPHGVIELTAIAISGAAGIIVAYRVVVPGRLKRVDSLRLSALTGGKLVFGAGLMLIVAGTIEGFFTPSAAPIWIKYTFAAVMSIVLILYFTFAGRSPKLLVPR